MTLDLSFSPANRRPKPPPYALANGLGYFMFDPTEPSQINILDQLTEKDKEYLSIPSKGQCGYYLDLKKGFSPDLVGLEPKPENDCGLDLILKWAMENAKTEAPSSLGGLFGGAEFVVHPRALQQVGEAPYTGRAPYDLVVTKYKGTIFICHVDTEKEAERKWAKRDDVYLAKYVQTKFERIMTGNGDVIGDVSSIYPSRNLIGCATYTLANHSVCLGSHVICSDLDTGDRVAFAIIPWFKEGSKAEAAFKKRRLCSDWLKNFLTGTPRVIYGVRDSDYRVNSFMDIRVNDIMEISCSGDVVAIWAPEYCLDAIDRFLNFVKKGLSTTGDLQYVRYVFGPETGLVTPMNDVSGKHRFLSSEFLSATKDMLDGTGTSV